MKKIFLTLLFIMTFFTINNINASYDCNKTLTIDQNGGSYSICGGLVNLEIPVGAVSSKTTLDTNDYLTGDNIEFSYDYGLFESLGIGGVYDSGPSFLKFSLKDSNGNETTFKKGVKLSFKGDKNAKNIGVSFGKGYSFTAFYKDNYKVLIENSGKSNQSFTLSSINNYNLDKNTYKISLSDLSDINGTFRIASFLLGDLDAFTPINLSDQEDIKKKLSKIKELIIDKKDEILGYEKNLDILYYTFYDDEKIYNDFVSIYRDIRYGRPQNKQNLDNFYNDLISKFDGIYNDLKKRGSNPVIDRYETILNSRDKVLSNTYDLIVNSNFKLSRINNVLSKSINKAKYEDFIKKLNSLKELYKNCDNKYSSYSHYSYVNKSSNTPIFNYDIDLLEKGVKECNTQLNNNIDEINNINVDNLLNIDEGNIEKSTNDYYSNLQLKNNYNIELNGYKEDLKRAKEELVIFQGFLDKGNKLLNSNISNKENLKKSINNLTNFIKEWKNEITNIEKQMNNGELFNLYKNGIQGVGLGSSYHVYNNFFNIKVKWQDTGSPYDIQGFLEGENNYDEEDNNNETTSNIIEKKDDLKEKYNLNDKEKNAISIVASKINKMSNIKKNKYKNLLNQYLDKFEYGTRKYEIVKGVIDLIK